MYFIIFIHVVIYIAGSLCAVGMMEWSATGQVIISAGSAGSQLGIDQLMLGSGGHY